MSLTFVDFPEPIFPSKLINIGDIGDIGRGEGVEGTEGIDEVEDEAEDEDMDVFSVKGNVILYYNILNILFQFYILKY
jgi:hypothetical protein